ncbi:metallophosphoesterase [Blastopirellula sp. JC732]|uniref:Metallophosphoesterase n=1 Tax=Blastopirellula sediminis TaxID=2894196 RepID=A0A9X1SIA2_9BACT|nr:metallophosphoesterase [Blastopirellula sediminis]MCC9606075.1 metallophosphoesterase [Blastopirellula sediminis]MCC9630626.1 metallophosphoesterase [Blastopirellula sediminis]
MSVETSLADQVITRYLKAADINLSNPNRHGNLVTLSTGGGATDVMVTADLHGNRRNFQRILELAALDANPERHLVLQEVCHGGPTYPQGGGCMSHLMLEDVAQLVCEYPYRVHFLLSNHELAEMVDFPILKGGKMLNLMFRAGLQEMYGNRTADVRDSYLHFLRSLPIGVKAGERLLICHSLPEKCDQKPFDPAVFDRPLAEEDLSCQGDVGRMVWGRDFRQENADAFAEQTGAQYFLTGHEPSTEGFQTPNSRQVILDCCCQNGCYAIVPVDDELSYGRLLAEVQRLHKPTPYPFGM